MAGRQRKMPRQSYSPAFKREMVGRISLPADIPVVALHAGIASRLLHKWVEIAAQRPDLETLRPGPKPLLPPEAEKHIHDWILGRQSVCRPVGRMDIMRKARAITELVCDTSVGDGWYQRFMSRHLDLAVRKAQVLTKARGSVVDVDLVEQAKALKIEMVLLPPNATHLLQPLDVAVFSSLKGKLKKLLSEMMEEQGDGSYKINKDSAIELVSWAWKQSHLGRNAAAGFKVCGLFPLSLVKMQRRLDRFKWNGTSEHKMQASWLQVKEHVEAEVLTLPPTMPTSKKRKTVQVSGQLLTCKLLQEAGAKPLAKPKKKSKKSSQVQIDVIQPGYQFGVDGYMFTC